MTAQLQPHQERVIAERAELHEKIARLDAFIRSDRFTAVDIHEQVRMTMQLHFMLKYRQCLDARIEAFQAPRPV